MAFRGVLLIKSSNQALADGTITSANAVTWDSKLYDTDNFVDLGTSSTRIVIPSGVSFVQFVGHASIGTDNPGTADWATLYLVKNGVNDGIGSDPGGMFRIIDQPIPSGFTILGGVSAPLQVTTGDFFELYAFITGDTGTVTGDANTHRTWFAMEVLE
jgi:hypothetical protein